MVHVQECQNPTVKINCCEKSAIVPTCLALCYVLTLLNMSVHCWKLTIVTRDRGTSNADPTATSLAVDIHFLYVPLNCKTIQWFCRTNNSNHLLFSMQ